MKIVQTPQFRRKRIRQQGKASRTPGKLKNESCQTNPIKRFFACSTKAYKHPQYEVWHEEFKRMNIGGMR